MDASTCRCGHGPEAHEHYRPGRDCALCGPGGCPRYRPPSRLLRRLAVLLGRRR